MFIIEFPQSRTVLGLHRYLLNALCHEKKKPRGKGISTHLYHTCAGIQKDTAFGFFGYFFIFVKVHNIGVIWQLSQLEVALFE
jgi:hypothetical protein